MNHLTNTDLPRALIGTQLKEKSDFNFVPDAELIAGKSVVVNKSGMMYLYMGDDPRQAATGRPTTQIIVNNFNGELFFLGIESKKGIKLVMETKLNLVEPII